MERLAFGDFGLHAMTHSSGVLDWPAPLPSSAKYAFQYLFTQAKFGLMCPISVSDTSNHVLARYGSEALKSFLLSQDLDVMWKGAVDRAGVHMVTASDPAGEERCRSVASVRYHVVSAVLLAVEGAELGDAGRDARRLLLARQVVTHRIEPTDPFAANRATVDAEIDDLLLTNADVPLARASALLST